MFINEQWRYVKLHETRSWNTLKKLGER